MEEPRQRRVVAYGLDRSVVSWVVRPRRPAEVAEAIDLARRRGWSICPAGGRNSFGDVFLLGEHLSLDLTGLDRVVSFDIRAGTITVEAGVLEREVLAYVMPAGWHLAAASGSLWNTIGGNLSSNINGKDSWQAGSFGDQVESFKLVLADGSTREVNREREPSLFAAVIAGLGLIGVVTEVTLRLRRIPSVILEQRSRPIGGVVELARSFAELRVDDEDFAYAWVDPFATGADLGRAVFESARFVDGAEAPRGSDFRRGFVPRARIAGLSPRAFWGIVSRGWKVFHALGLDGTAFRLMSAVKYDLARRAGERSHLVSFPAYQYPMVKLFPHWNLKFAPEGFNEVQALFPTERFPDALRAVLAFCRDRGHIPEVCAVRRHQADEYDLSFSGDGLSVTLPFPLAAFSAVELDDFRLRLTETILSFGGKVYLSKFPYLTRAAFAEMYPGHRSFLATKERVDPQRLFWSEAAARLLA